MFRLESGYVDSTEDCVRLEQCDVISTYRSVDWKPPDLLPGDRRFLARRACAEPVDRYRDSARGGFASRKLAPSREIDPSIRDIAMPAPRIDVPA